MTGAVYSDFGQLASLRAQAQSNPNAALETVAEQFEGLFVQMMMQSMRDATIEGGLFQSHALDSYQQMTDKQMSLHLSQNGGIGLARFLVEQLQVRDDVGRSDVHVGDLSVPTPSPIEIARSSKAIPVRAANFTSVAEET